MQRHLALPTVHIKYINITNITDNSANEYLIQFATEILQLTAVINQSTVETRLRKYTQLASIFSSNHSSNSVLPIQVTFSFRTHPHSGCWRFRFSLHADIACLTNLYITTQGNSKVHSLTLKTTFSIFQHSLLRLIST